MSGVGWGRAAWGDGTWGEDTTATIVIGGWSRGAWGDGAWGESLGLQATGKVGNVGAGSIFAGEAPTG